jgi:hypothetical protein
MHACTKTQIKTPLTTMHSREGSQELTGRVIAYAPQPASVVETLDLARVVALRVGDGVIVGSVPETVYHTRLSACCAHPHPNAIPASSHASKNSHGTHVCAPNGSDHALVAQREG